MTIDKSLRIRRGLTSNRSVLTRAERIAVLKKEGRWTDDESVLGLPKVRTSFKVKTKKQLKAEAAAISNLRLINHDAIEVLKHQVPLASLTRLNLYFPDPWPKKRHHKRRIVQPGFVDLVAEAGLLKPGDSFMAKIMEA